ncbi:MAG: ExbD/TolR family protein [Planctomycetota bacterium]
MRIAEETQGDEVSPDLTPMIDVVFLLLIFFMLATTFLDPEKEITIELPEAQSGVAEQKEPHELIINVMRNGSIILSGQKVEEDDLLRTLKLAANKDPETQITIRGDRMTRHEWIVRVMDACGQAGLTNLAVGTLEGT